MTSNKTSAGRKNEIFFILLPTLECNLRCSYCFEQHPPGRWDLDSTRIILARIFDLLQDKNLDRCRFHWQGGEPLLLGRDYWQEVLSMASSLADRQGVRLIQSMQTNLIPYRSDFAPIVEEYLNGILGTSFEPNGMRQLPNDSSGAFSKKWKSAYDAARQDGLEVGILSLLNDEALETGAESYLAKLREKYGIKRVRFSLPFSQPGQQGKGFWLDARKTGEFLAEAYRIWYKAGGDDWMEIRPFSYLTARIRGEVSDSSGLCVYARNCVDIALSILPNGDITLCDSFSNPEAAMIYGNIFKDGLTEIYESPNLTGVRHKVAGLINSDCTGCRYLAYCFGGCLVRSYPQGSSKEVRYHYCQTNKLLFQAIESLALKTYI